MCVFVLLLWCQYIKLICTRLWSMPNYFIVPPHKYWCIWAVTIQLFSVMIVVIFCNFLHCLVGGISVSIFVQFETKQTRKNKYSHQTLKASEARHFDQLLLSVSQHAWETLKAWAGRPSLFCKLEFANSFVFLTEHIFAQRNWIFFFSLGWQQSYSQLSEESEL